MAVALDPSRVPDPPAGSDVSIVEDRPRPITISVSGGDRVFRSISVGAAAVALLIIGGTAVYLGVGSREALSRTGLVNFFTESVWNPSVGKFGVWGLLVGTFLIGSIAVVAAVPLGLGMALFTNEYAPMRVRSILTSTIDLLAAIPSLVFGMFGLFVLSAPLQGIAQWFGDHLNAIPFFRVGPEDSLAKSAFIGGVVVAIMILPIITSVSRDVMAQCPREQCEGALALGGSRWGMIKAVIFPFSRSGIVGAILLAFGRALGETIAIAIIVSLVYQANLKVLTEGGGSIAQLIAIRFGEANELEKSGLVAAGLALFIVTFLVNLGARRIVARARSAQ